MQVFYTVRPGDTLYNIAMRWELPVISLIAANNINPPYMIYVGQQLSVPPGVNVVRVKPEDSVFTIAQFFGVPQEVIIEVNRLVPPYHIQVGQLIKVPPGNPFYVVQPGDTLFHIARRFNVITGERINYEVIRQVNQLPSYDLFLGMRLIIPYASPGDRGMIAYVTNRGGEFDLWLYNPLDGASIQLTNGIGATFSTPYWSPDSRKIAFVGVGGVIYVVDLLGAGIAQIDQVETGVLLSWSPDSQKIVYTKQNKIVLYDVINHQAERIDESGVTDAQWFPSGVELLFQAPDQEGFSQLFRMRTDGTKRRQITENTGGRLNYVRLSPDGMHALYTTPGVSISIIFTVDLTTGNVNEIRGGPLAKNYFPSWSPDSLTIAYSATAFEDRGYFSLMRTSGRRGEEDQTRAISNCFATPVTWSQDGRKVVYLSGCYNEAMANEMWVIDVFHPVPIKLVEGASIASIQWSPAPIPSAKKTYMNNVYKIYFQYPADWQRVDDVRYEGPDGFFQVSALFSEEPIHQVCQSEAFHQLAPYGSDPRIIHTQIQNQGACFIYPSDDQPAEMRGQAALIVQYPMKIHIEGAYYNYFVLWADKGHIDEIGSTLSFLM
ncbi:LysM peptidoglycan-binding domain-containing protein [Halalkalibacter alkaliphilus]|uniref:LysM peptidoglycan-binding domain-containing protein n=1 Tax=Halalkalibacter alkaliphilus TaxID=2917993 RepID=A0A9X2I813_9BACI|nr:LysM peptidoglycan-binding domain-containing protein [Halalkalibacter alkaliphilus]MCL7749483.1 LysM peptidoglycan-binding domain-containing protein [Halalkalibacter alkaliphilus]